MTADPDPGTSTGTGTDTGIAAGSGHGHGKVILLGEHAVVYGHPALAGAIDRGVAVTAFADDRPRLRVAAWDLDIGIDDVHPAARAFQRIVESLGAGQPRLSFIADAQIPAGAGMGSSAALAVAVARALAAATGLATTEFAIAGAANASETEFHHRPSGVDVALAMRGGIGVFRRDVGFVQVAAEPVTLAIGLSGEPRSTAAMVDAVAAITGGNADDPRLVSLGEHAAAGADELARGDVTALGPRLDAAHAILAELGVSTPRLDELVAIARSAGALGAKLTGAGGGGAVVAFGPGREDAILAGWRAVGRDGFLVTLG